MPWVWATSSASAISIRQVEQLGQRQSTLGDALPKSRAVEILHRDEAPALRFTDFVDHADVGMVQGGSGTRFPAKSFQHDRVLGDQFRQEFKRHQPAQLGVLGLVDDTHPAATQFLDDPVVRDGMADHKPSRTVCQSDMLGSAYRQVNQ